MAKIQIICSNCGSTNVMRDAWATWCVEKQDRELGSVFDQGYCDKCEGEASLDEVEYDEVCEENEDYHL
jgi:hypothetical protein